MQATLFVREEERERMSFVRCLLLLLLWLPVESVFDEAQAHDDEICHALLKDLWMLLLLMW